MAKDFSFSFSQWFIDLMAFALFVMEEQFRNPNLRVKTETLITLCKTKQKRRRKEKDHFLFYAQMYGCECIYIRVDMILHYNDFSEFSFHALCGFLWNFLSENVIAIKV